jgi:NDP-sugar pyrophosphorylase family protein
VHFSAILLSSKRPAYPALSYSQMDGSQRDTLAGLSPCGILQTPLSCVELFGQSILERTVSRLRKAGLCNISVIAESDCISFHETREVRIATPNYAHDRWTDDRWTDDHWAGVKRALLKDVQRGIDTVLIARLGAYVEADLSDALRFHRAKAQAVTPFHDAHGTLCYWIVDAARVLSTSGDFPPDEDRIINAPQPYQVQGYVNRLADPRDFRRLAVDAFLGRCSIAPGGREVKPGVWIDDGARLHKTARLVAPCYVGSNARVQARAVITRCSNLERNCNVGEGSLVSNASLLPHTMIGRGLDVSTALIAGNDFIDLGRNVSLRIEDPNLISNVPPIKRTVPVHLPEDGEADRVSPALDFEYSEYLSRAKGLLLEVFKGGV